MNLIFERYQKGERRRCSLPSLSYGMYPENVNAGYTKPGTAIQAVQSTANRVEWVCKTIPVWVSTNDADLMETCCSTAGHNSSHSIVLAKVCWLC